MSAKSILLVYHFFYPDPVISARLFSDLSVSLVERGYAVSVFTGNRLIRSDEELARHENWKGVRIERFARPGFSQGSNVGRLLNSAILQLKWLMAFWRQRGKFDAVIVGTDPQFAYMIFPFIRLMHRRVKLIHWAFDLYPEAIMVNSPRWMKALAQLTRPFVPLAYRRLDVMVDIGSCMRNRLARYGLSARKETITPWALAEPRELRPADADVRRSLFGEASLGLLYSGTVGYAHDLSPFIALARECRRRGIDVAFCFAGVGNQYEAQTAAIRPEDTNIRLAEFAPEEALQQRLEAADIHLISLREGWEGIVVPSKFFAALAIGRPVLFSGSAKSAISGWCDEFQIGWRLTEMTVETLAWLCEDESRIAAMRARAFRCYKENFSSSVMRDRWLRLL